MNFSSLLLTPILFFSPSLCNNATHVNYFPSAEDNKVINMPKWYETPTFKKEVTSTNNYESFATHNLAKETMIKALNQEKEYMLDGGKAHWFISTYTNSTGFSSIFNGKNKYSTYFALSQNWITLEEGIDKVQQLNKKDINEYDFGADGTSYKVCIMPEFTNKGNVVTKKVYVFVYKDVTNDVLNPNFDVQINSFIDKQAENLIVEKEIFGSDGTRQMPAPLFADPTCAPEINPVFSSLKLINSNEPVQVRSNDGTYYKHAYYSEESGMNTFNYDSGTMPEYSFINPRELWSLTDDPTSSPRTYEHYIAQETSSSKRVKDWQKMITSSSNKYPLFQNVLSNIIDGSIKDYVLDVNSEYFTGYNPGDIKIAFATNDKTWIRITIEHTDFPDVKETKDLSSSCNWELSPSTMIYSNGFSFSEYSIPLLNAIYTFQCVNSLGENILFSFKMTGAPKETANIALLSTSEKEANDTWEINPSIEGSNSFNLDTTIHSDLAVPANISVKNVVGNVNIATSDIVRDDKVIGKRINVQGMDVDLKEEITTFTIYYPGTEIEKKCSYFIVRKKNDDDSIIDSIRFSSASSEAKYDKDNKTVSATGDLSFVVPQSSSREVLADGRTITYVTKYEVMVENDSKVYLAGEEVLFSPGNYKATIKKTTSIEEANGSITESFSFSVSVKSIPGSTTGGISTWALVIIIVVPCLIIATTIIIIVRVRKNQSLKKAK